MWFTKPIKQILLEHLNIDTSYNRAQSFEDAIDGDINGFYYLSAATPSGTNDAALKLILGPIMEELNSRKLSFNKINTILPAATLRLLVEYVDKGLVNKNFTKQILNELYGQILTEKEIISLLSDSKWNSTSNDDLEQIVKNIVEKNEEQAIAAKTNPKIQQWFVGQVMKETKGKADPGQALEIIKKLFS